MLECFLFLILCGRLAQLVEHLPYKQVVIGSSPVPPTTFTPITLHLHKNRPGYIALAMRPLRVFANLGHS